MVLNMGQNVIELSQYRDRDHFPALRTLGNYWNNLADGAVPYRSDLDPRGLSNALRSIVLMERISTGNARIRISGRYLCDVLQETGAACPIPCCLMVTVDRLRLISWVKCSTRNTRKLCGSVAQKELGAER
jgi:hypothetical protein